MSDHVCRSKVFFQRSRAWFLCSQQSGQIRVSMGGRCQVQTPHETVRARIRRRADELGPEPPRQRRELPKPDRCVAPAGFTARFVVWLKVLCSGVPFPKNFRDTVRTIFRRLFRVYAHLYSNHFDQICALGIEGIRIGLGERAFG